MPSYGNIEDDIEEHLFRIAHTEVKTYTDYTVYVEVAWLGDYTPPISDFSPEELIIRDKNGKEVKFNELPNHIKNDITKEII